ncbi:MAG: DinB family protein [Candidatus Acidiferrales bacterium]
MPRIKWFDRKFDFNFPADLYPELIERLRGTPARVEELVKGLPASILTKRDGEHWSIQENIGHLLDLEELFSARLDDFDHKRPKLTAADLSNEKTHNAQHNRQPIETLLAEFRRARHALVERLDNADPLFFCRVSHHPRLDKPMRVVDALYFQAEHDDYHLARISELIPYFEETA